MDEGHILIVVDAAAAAGGQRDSTDNVNLANKILTFTTPLVKKQYCILSGNGSHSTKRLRWFIIAIKKKN